MTDHSTTYTCTVCHETYEDLPALGFIAPHQAGHPLVRDYTHGIRYAEARARVDAALHRFQAASC